MQAIEDMISEGFSLHQGGKLDEAENVYQQALKANGENAEVCNLMGVLKLQRNEVLTAIEWIEKAISIKPCEYFYETLFQAYIRNNDYQKLVNYSETIIHQYPKNFSLLFNIALAYKNLKRNRNAIKFYDKALKIDPSSYLAWYNLAHIYSVEGEGQNAVSALKICKKLKPEDIDTDYFLSIALMRTRNYDKGLKLFESRLCRETAVALQNKTYPHLASRDRIWKGENIKDKTLFVYYEAGFGDVIMFSRYLPLAKKRCKKLVFYPQKSLVPLFVESGLGIDDLIEGYIPESSMNFDVHLPLLSLPYVLGLKGKRVFESPEGYMRANKELIAEYKERYFNNNKIKIGIKWQGNTYYDKDRVIPAEAFSPLIEIDNMQFYSFQTFEGAEKTSKLTEKYNVTDIGKDLIDFGQTAAALSNLNLVICNDTSLAHLAGALGIPCFVLLPYETNWRWHDDMSHSDWYDSLSLFRQKIDGDWTGSIEEVKEKLIKAVSNFQSINS